MSGDLRFRVGELFGPAAACSFLGPAELEALLDGRLAPSRLAAWREHTRICDACAALRDEADDIERLATKGPLATETRLFERTNARVRERLGLGPEPRQRRFPTFRILVPVAALAALVFVLLPAHRPILIESLPELPFSPPPAVRSAPGPDPWTEAGAAWDAGDMAAAIRVLEPAAEALPDDPTLRIYLGLARLRQGDPAGAVESLRRADRLQDPPSEITRWLLAAALERSGRFEEACSVLASVAEAGGARADEARRVVGAYCPRNP